VSQRGAAEDVIGDIRLRISVRPFDWPTVPKAINPCPLPEHELHTFYLIHVVGLIDLSFPGQPSITHTIAVKILTESINLLRRETFSLKPLRRFSCSGTSMFK
jgi:hypothetical protein